MMIAKRSRVKQHFLFLCIYVFVIKLTNKNFVPKTNKRKLNVPPFPAHTNTHTHKIGIKEDYYFSMSFMK